MRLFASLSPLAVLVVFTPLAEAKYLHCYNSEAPAGIEEGPSELQQKLLFLEFGSVITLYRKACGFLDETDRQYIEALYGRAGCTQKSDIGQNLERILEADLTEVEGFAAFDRQDPEHRGYVEEFCALVGETPWPVYRADFTPISQELFSGYQESLRAIQEHRARYIEKLNSDQ